LASVTGLPFGLEACGVVDRVMQSTLRESFGQCLTDLAILEV
jgi:hypothetical protein